MVGKAHWDNCKSCLERKKERKKCMLLSKIVKIQSEKTQQNVKMGWMLELTWLAKGPHLF